MKFPVPSPQSLAMPEAIRREACPGPRRWWLSSAPSSTFWQFKTNFCAMELDKWTFWRASKKRPGVHGITWEKKHLCCYIHNNLGILPQQVPSVQKHETSAADLPAQVPNQWDEKGRIYSPSTTLMEARYLLVYGSLTTWLWAWSWRFSVCCGCCRSSRSSLLLNTSTTTTSTTATTTCCRCCLKIPSPTQFHPSVPASRSWR